MLCRTIWMAAGLVYRVPFPDAAPPFKFDAPEARADAVAKRYSDEAVQGYLTHEKPRPPRTLQ